MQKRTSVVSLTVLIALAGVIVALGGCASMGYYWQGFQGQMGILNAARPIDDWLADEKTSPALRQRPLQAISAATIGAEADAQQEAKEMKAQGLETSVYGVPAYSTLGYLNWLGGDPLLSTFTGWQEGDFSGLLFHELAHQLLYVKNDTAFNESFATTVERIGTPIWLQGHASLATQQRWQQGQLRRTRWQQLTRGTRAKLQSIYEKNSAQAPDEKALIAIKSEVFAEFRAQYALLRAEWLASDEPLLTTPLLRQQYLERLAQTDDWVAQANNARFGALAAYDDWVAAMTHWHRELQNGQPPSPEGWQRFYAQMRELAALPKPERTLQLCAHQPADIPAPAACKAR